MSVQITVFEKANCVYCTRVIKVLEAMVKKAADELEIEYHVRNISNEQVKDQKDGGMLQTGDDYRFEDKIFRFKMVDIKSEPAFAALCIKLTGTFTVPQVFFSQEYVGDARKFNCCLENSSTSKNEFASEYKEDSCPEIYSKLKSMAAITLQNKLKGIEEPEIVFPPLPNAKMVKVTNDLAFSSQPTTKQLQNLKHFGFNYVVNLLTYASPVYNKKEKALLLESGLPCANLQLHGFNEHALLAVIQEFDKIYSDKANCPILVHDEIGQNSGLVVLLLVSNLLIKQAKQQHLSAVEGELEQSIAIENAVTVDKYKQWAADLGLELSDPNCVVVGKVLNKLKSLSSVDYLQISGQNKSSEESNYIHAHETEASSTCQ